MRLLQVHDLNFQEVPSHGPFPAYAILSHTWIQPSCEEVTYQDLLTLDIASIRQKQGWRKVQHSIDEARREGIPYVWVDTCCINKQDPTELTEAINCMFNWYSQSRCCYVFLSDFKNVDEAHGHGYDGIASSKWFTRGWTLQELIAPCEVKFYDQEWDLVTTRAISAPLISEITCVDTDLLKNGNDPATLPQGLSMARLEQYSIAQRMSWAASRETSRSEDRAYSLLGLFNIVMPLHYGEGAENAFKRLQQEIIKQSADQSILAWEWPSHTTPRDISDSHMSFLAPSPDCFKSRSHVIPSRSRQSSPYTISNVGLEINAYLVKFKASTPRRNINFISYDERHSDRIFMSPEPPITPLKRAEPLRDSETETSKPFVAAVLSCSSTVDPSSVYMLPLAPAPMGHYFLTGSLQCEQFAWTSVLSEMEPCFSNQPWRKITILRAPLRLLQDRTIAESRARFVKVDLSSGQRLANMVTSELFWPPNDWNENTLTYLPKEKHNTVNTAAINVRCRWFAIPAQLDTSVTVAFSYGWGRIFDLQAEIGGRAPKLETLKAFCQTLRTNEAEPQNVKDTIVVSFEGSGTLSVTMKKVETPCDEFWHLELRASMPDYLKVRRTLDEFYFYSKDLAEGDGR